MKLFAVLFSTLLASQAYASQAKYACINPKGNDADESAFDAKNMFASVNGNNVYIKFTFTHSPLKGELARTTSESNLYYSDDLLNVAPDQTISAYIIVSRELKNNGKGEITLATHQVGDSQGAWWIKTKFNCKEIRY